MSKAAAFNASGYLGAVRKTYSRAAIAVVLTGFGLSLAGCGQTTGDRAVSGGLIGAGTGAAIGAVTGGNPATGAVVGGAVGAIGGAVTRPEDINLGRPVWR